MAAAVEGPPMTVLPQAPSNCEPGGQHALLEDADDNPLYYTDSFRMYCLKVLPCSKRYCHDWTTCPFAHPAEKAKRRDPRIYSYTGVACPEMKKNNHCSSGDKCVYAHSVWEYWLHSSRYRTQLCNDGVSCKRKICFFAHTLEELRVSSVKVLNNPEAGRLGEGFELDPFAPSAPSNGSHTQGMGGRYGGGGPQRKVGHHGSRHHMGARHGLANGSHFHSSNGIGGGHGGISNGQQMQNFSMADLHQLTQLQAKLQAATGMGSLGALQAQLMQQQQQQRMGGGLGPGMMPSMAADPAASEHLVHQLMQQQHQQQPHHQHQQTDVMQIMAGALSSQQQQQQQAAAVAATAAMAAATHAHTPAAVTAATAHMQMLQNGGLPAPPGGMELQQQVGAGTAVAGRLNAGVMGVQGGMLTQQQQQEQHAAALAGIGGLQGGARNGMAPSLNMHNMGGGRRGNNSSSARPGLSSFANHAHRAPALGAGLPHDQQHTAPSALLAQQLAGLGINGGGLGAVSPLPPPAPTHINGNHRVAHPPYSSSGFAAEAHGVFGGGPTFRRQRSLPPPHAAPVPIAQGAGRRSSLQLHAHPRAQQQQQQQHGGGDFSLAAHALPTHTPRREGSGKLSPVLDPGAGSMIPINSTMATMPSAAVMHTAASAPVQMPRPGSRGAAAAAAAAVASSFFSNNSLSRTGSATSSTVGHLTNVESVTNAEEAVLNA